jgi:hypothetical protein
MNQVAIQARFWLEWLAAINSDASRYVHSWELKRLQ